MATRITADRLGAPGRQKDRKVRPPRKQVLRQVLRADPSVEYFLYVASGAGPGAPLFVSVHGLSRNAREHAELFSRYCERHGVILVAPHFGERFDYRRLGREKRADLALNAILDEVTESTGASDRIHLFGFGGGALFAHRYTLAHPKRVAAALVAYSDSFTFPDGRKRFPRGIRKSPKYPDLSFEPADFLRVPITVLVGRKDLPGREALRKEGRANAAPVELARKWVAAMRAAADAHKLEASVCYEEFGRRNQSFPGLMKRAGLGERVFQALLNAPPDDVRHDVSPARAPEPRAGKLVGSELVEGPQLEIDALEQAQLAPWLHRSPRRFRRIAWGILFFALTLALATPLALWVVYRYEHVVSRNALVRGHIAEVGAPLDGVVRSVEVQKGDRVRAGQIVARLEDRQLRARARQARSHLEKAERELAVERLAIENERQRLETRVKQGSAHLAAARAQVAAARSRAEGSRRKLEMDQSLAEQGFVAEEAVRATETELRTALALVAAAEADHRAAAAAEDSAEVDSEGIAVREQRIAVLDSTIGALRAELSVAEADIEGTVIRAPDDGAVLLRIVEPGGSTVVGQPIVSLWIGRDVWIEAWIDEEDLSYVEIGSKATVTLMPFPDKELLGTVEGISASTDFELPPSEVPQPRAERMRATPVVGVRIRLDEPHEGLFPGMSAVVAIRKKEL